MNSAPFGLAPITVTLLGVTIIGSALSMNPHFRGWISPTATIEAQNSQNTPAQARTRPLSPQEKVDDEKRHAEIVSHFIVQNPSNP